jgi:putative SOS response-associated peptidase YedK
VREPKSAPIDGERELFGLLTTDANAIVARIHRKAMPVILTMRDEIDLWLAAEAPKALKLQRPLPDDAPMIVLTAGDDRNVAKKPWCENEIYCTRCVWSSLKSPSISPRSSLARYACR